MGHAFEQATFPGKLTENEVRKEFRALGREQRDDCDHDDWGGGWYDFNSLKFTGKSFDTKQQANDYLEGLHNESYWAGVCHAVRCKEFPFPKSAENHSIKIRDLNKAIAGAQAKLRVANEKRRVNKRAAKPAYVAKAESYLDDTKARIQPKIDARQVKIDAIIATAAAKCNKSIWMIGGWHREG